MLFKRFFHGNNLLKLLKPRFHACISSFTWRTHTCGELSNENEGQEVVLCGWNTYRRCDRFIILRDAYGHTQIIFDDAEGYTAKYYLSLPLESVLQVKGIVCKRPVKNINKNMPTGQMEVLASDIKVLSISKPKLPITSKDYHRVGDVTKLKYRYLALRIPQIQERLRLRSKVLMKIREFLHDTHGFVDVETPTLFKKTPGGAKEFIVPTKFPGSFYSLVQSPQQFKQLLMIGQLDRYFQIARCYRNEGKKVDRQPEFTQVDIEASFVTSEHIMNLVEKMLLYCWPEDLKKISIPFQRISYADAIKFYGTDKPDLRYDLKLNDITEDMKNLGLEIFKEASGSDDFIVSSIVVPNGSKFLKGKVLKEINKESENYNLKTPITITIKEDLIWSSSIAKHVPVDAQQKINEKLGVKPEDLIICSIGKQNQVSHYLGKIRTFCAKSLRSIGVDLHRPGKFSFVWVTDFPLFCKNSNDNFESAHHPFTAAHPDDADLIFTAPEKARSQHYDLVLNGQEIAGGSIRIHDSQIQKYVLEDILKEDVSSLQHLLDALNSGCPPHGGIALGVDRLLAIMCNCESIADVIAFPKSIDGKDLMSGSPAPISDEDKLLYHIEPVLKSL